MSRARRYAVRAAAGFNALGLVCKNRARHNAARALYRCALWLLERGGHAEPAHIATLYHNLGGIEHAAGNHAVGEALARKGLAIRTGHCAHDVLGRARDMVALGALLDGQAQYAEAERLYRDALSAFSRAPRANAADIGVALNDLGAQYAERGLLDQAVDLLERAAALKRHVLGARHPDVAVTLNNLAVAYRRRGDVTRAAARYAEAVLIFERSLGSSHPNTVTCRANRARCTAA